MEDRPSDFSLSVSRALKILASFSEARPALGLSEISREVGISKSSASRFLAALQNHGFVTRDPVARRYRPGIETFRIGNLYMNARRLHEAAVPIIRKLADETGFTAYVSNPQEGSQDAMVILAAVEGRGPIRYTIPVGQRMPLYCTATGKAALAAVGPDRAKASLGRLEIRPRTDFTITDRDALMKELAAINKQGYSLNWEENTLGVASVAAPVIGDGKSLMAVVSVGFATSQIDRGNCGTLGATVKKTAQELAAVLDEKPNEEETP